MDFKIDPDFLKKINDNMALNDQIFSHNGGKQINNRQIINGGLNEQNF